MRKSDLHLAWPMLHMVTEYVCHNSSTETSPEVMALWETVEKAENYLVDRLKDDVEEYGFDRSARTRRAPRCSI